MYYHGELDYIEMSKRASSESDSELGEDTAAVKQPEGGRQKFGNAATYGGVAFPTALKVKIDRKKAASASAECG